MRIKPLLIIVFVALELLATSQAIQAQKAEARAVIFDTQNRATVQFAAKNEKLDCCGVFVSNTVIDNEEEALAVRVAHVHRQGLGAITFPESGWLYITASRIVFVVEEGDSSHGFDLPRTDLTDKPASKPKVDWSMSDWSGIQINLKERLQPSNSREQKFSFLSWSNSKCKLFYYNRVTDLIQRIVNDFVNSLAEFKQLAATLKETGKIQQPGLLVPPSTDPIKTVAAAASNNTSNLPSVPIRLGRADTVTTGVEINSTPRAKFYVDGQFLNSNTPATVPLSVGEHTVRLMRCGYKIWEQKIRIQEGTVTDLNIVLEKQ